MEQKIAVFRRCSGTDKIGCPLYSVEYISHPVDPDYPNFSVGKKFSFRYIELMPDYYTIIINNA